MVNSTSVEFVNKVFIKLDQTIAKVCQFLYKFRNPHSIGPIILRIKIKHTGLSLGTNTL